MRRLVGFGSQTAWIIGWAREERLRELLISYGESGYVAHHSHDQLCDRIPVALLGRASKRKAGHAPLFLANLARFAR